VKCILIFAALAMLASNVFGRDSANTFYLQLVRGTDTAQPPQPGCRPVGRRLAKTFKPVFNWKYYWELNLRETVVRSGEKVRLPLSTEREVEIDLRQPKERRITVYQDRKVTDRAISPVGSRMTLIGGSRQRLSGAHLKDVLLQSNYD
jgi:hypothetical protein